MNAHQFEITATLNDESSIADAALHLGMALAKVGDVSVTTTEQGEALGMNRREIILSIVISFTTSVAATVATDLIKEALKNVHCTAVVHVDVSYHSAGSAQSNAVASPGTEKTSARRKTKHTH